MAFVIEGVEGVVPTKLTTPPCTMVVDDEDARTSRIDIANGSGTNIVGVRIDNRANTTEKAYLKFYSHRTPEIGTTPPTAVFRAMPGKVTEYVLPFQVERLTYAVHNAPGKANVDAPANPVPITIGLANF